MKLRDSPKCLQAGHMHHVANSSSEHVIEPICPVFQGTCGNSICDRLISDKSIQIYFSLQPSIYGVSQINHSSTHSFIGEARNRQRYYLLLVKPIEPWVTPVIFRAWTQYQYNSQPIHQHAIHNQATQEFK